MSSELVERLQITVRQPNESASDLIDRWRKDRADALARLEALESANARKDGIIKEFLSLRSIWADPHNDDLCRRAREGGNADGSR